MITDLCDVSQEKQLVKCCSQCEQTVHASRALCLTRTDTLNADAQAFEARMKHSENNMAHEGRDRTEMGDWYYLATYEEKSNSL